MLDATGKKDEPEAIGLGETRFLNLAVDAKRDELLAT